MVAGLQIKVFKSIGDVGKSAIDALANDGFFTYGWFKTLEASNAVKIAPFYLTAYYENELVAVAPLFSDLNGDYFVYGNYIPFVKRILHECKRLNIYEDKMLLCYSPFSFHSRILLANNNENLLSRMLSEIDVFAKKHSFLFTSFLFVSENDASLIKNLRNHGYMKFPWWQNSFYLDVEWHSFEEYVSSLTRWGRKNTRRELKKFAESGLVIEELGEFKDFSKVLSELHSNVHFKYNKNTKNVYDALFFENLSDYAAEKTKLFLLKKDGQPVGFSLSLVHGDVLNCHMSGMKYAAVDRSNFAYFNVAYYARIKWAINHGIKKVYYSFTAGTAKRQRGCKKEKIFSFVKCHNPILNPLINMLAKTRGQL